MTKMSSVQLYDNVHKAVLYIHSEFCYLVDGVMKAGLLGKEYHKRIEEQFMHRYGVTKIKDVYLQDEVTRDEVTGNLLSTGPDEVSLDFLDTLGDDGNPDEKLKKKFIIKYDRRYKAEAKRNAKLNSGKKQGADKGGCKDKENSNGRSNRPDSGGSGKAAVRNNGDAAKVNEGRVRGTTVRKGKGDVSADRNEAEVKDRPAE